LVNFINTHKAPLSIVQVPDSIRGPLFRLAHPSLVMSLLNGLCKSFEGKPCTKEAISQKQRELLPGLLMEHFQGRANTSQALLGALQVRQGQGAQFEQQVSWLKEKIESSDLAWREQFLAAITGNKTLQPGAVVGIKPSHRGGVFEIHTCFNSIDLPRADLSKEEFLASLDAALTGQNYNIA